MYRVCSGWENRLAGSPKSQTCCIPYKARCTPNIIKAKVTKLLSTRRRTLGCKMDSARRSNRVVIMSRKHSDPEKVPV